LKVGYVTTFLPQHCGIATYTDFLIRGLQNVAPDIDIRVIAEDQAAPIKRNGFEVLPCWNRTRAYVTPILKHTKGLDVLHIQHEYGIYSYDDRMPILLENLPNSRKIITIHCIRPASFSPRGSVDEIHAGKIAKLADEVIVHLETQKAILMRLGVPEEKITVIPHGTELSAEDQLKSRRKLQLPEEGKILLVFGVIRTHKCLHIAIEVLYEILKEKKKVYLFVAGRLEPPTSKTEQNYVSKVEAKIKDLGLDQNVIFHNHYYPNEDVPFIFAAADVALFPYAGLWEEDRSASGSLHLSIGAQRPMVASRIPKFEELKNICDELLIRSYNSSGIAKIVLRLFNDPEFSQYIHNRLEKYRSLTSWKNIAKKHLELYRN